MDAELDKYAPGKQGGDFSNNIMDLERELNEPELDDEKMLDKMGNSSNKQGMSKYTDNISELENMLGDSDDEDNKGEEQKISKIPQKSPVQSNVQSYSKDIPSKPQSQAPVKTETSLKDIIRLEMMVLNVGIENSLTALESEIKFCSQRISDSNTPEQLKRFFNDSMEAYTTKKKKILLLIAKGQLSLKVYCQSIMDSIRCYMKVLQDLKGLGASVHIQRTLSKIDIYKKENESLLSNGNEAFQEIVSRIEPKIKVGAAVEKARGQRSNEKSNRPERKKFHTVNMPSQPKGKYDLTGYIYVPDYSKCSQEMLVDIFGIRMTQYRNLGKYFMTHQKEAKEQFIKENLIPILSTLKKVEGELAKNNFSSLKTCLENVATGVKPDLLYGENENAHFSRLLKLQTILASTYNKISEQIHEYTEKGVKSSVLFKVKSSLRNLEEDYNYLLKLNEESWIPIPKIISNTEEILLAAPNEDIPGNKVIISFNGFNENPSKNRLLIKGNLLFKDIKYDFESQIFTGIKVSQVLAITLKEDGTKPLRGIDRAVVSLEILKKKRMSMLFGDKLMSTGKVKLSRFATLNCIEEDIPLKSEKDKKLTLNVEFKIRNALTPQKIEIQIPKISQKFPKLLINESIEEDLDLFEQTYSGQLKEKKEIPKTVNDPGNNNPTGSADNDIYIKPKMQLSKLSHAKEEEENQKISTIPDSEFDDEITRERLNFPEKDEVLSILYSALCNQMAEETRTFLKEQNNFTAYREAEELSLSTKKNFFKIQAKDSNGELDNDEVMANLKETIAYSRKLMDISIKYHLPSRANFFAERINILTNEFENAEIKYVQENIIEGYGINKNDEIAVKTFLQFTRSQNYPNFTNLPPGKSLAQIQKLEDPEYYFSSAFCMIVKMVVNQYLSVENKKTCRINLLRLQEKISKKNDDFMSKMMEGEIEPEMMLKSSNDLLSQDKGLLSYFTVQKNKEYCEFLKLRIKVTEFDIQMLMNQAEEGD